MDLKELGAYLFQPDLRDLLRIESLAWYDSAADDPHFKRWLDTGHVEIDDGWQGWLNRIRKDVHAGKAWRRVHVIAPVSQEPLNDYLRFELGVQYPLNAHAGEQIRILEIADPAKIGDAFTVNDGERVAVSTYDQGGKFQHADTPENPDHWVALARQIWKDAIPFAEWRKAHPEYFDRRRAA